MAPLPKKRHSKARSRKRKSTRTFNLSNMIVCPKCQSLRYPHRACPKCGFYKENEEKERSKTQKAS